MYGYIGFNRRLSIKSRPDQDCVIVFVEHRLTLAHASKSLSKARVTAVNVMKKNIASRYHSRALVINNFIELQLHSCSSYSET